MKSVRSNPALRRQNRVLGMHPTTLLAIMAIAAVIIAIFSVLELNSYIGWLIFLILSASIFVMAPNGLGDVAAKILPPPKITRGCNLYESPLEVVPFNKKKRK